MNSLFSVFDPVLFIINPLLEVQKVIVFFMVTTSFIFIVKLFLPAGCIENFLKESTAKKVEKLLSEGKILDTKELAKNGVLEV